MFHRDYRVIREDRIDKRNLLEHTERGITINKLNRLYHGQITLPNNENSFINLSDHQLAKHQEEILNL